MPLQSAITNIRFTFVRPLSNQAEKKIPPPRVIPGAPFQFRYRVARGHGHRDAFEMTNAMAKKREPRPVWAAETN